MPASLLTSASAQEVFIPDTNLNAVIRGALQKPNGPVTQQDMLSLTNLGAIFRNITNLQGLEAAQNLVALDLQDNRITNASVITNLTKLTVLDLSENQFSQLTIPGAMTNLTRLRLENGRLTILGLPVGLTKLTSLRLGFNQLTNLVLPADMTNLTEISAYQNQLTNVTLPTSLAKLSTLNLDGNQLARLLLPTGMTNLSFIALGENRLTSFTVPRDATNLTALRINDNQLVNLGLPIGLNHLSLLVVSKNPLRSFTLPSGLTSLAFLELNSDQLTNLTLPPDMQQLTALFVADNPLAIVVLSQQLAATGMASVVNSFRNQGINVFTYPAEARLERLLALPDAFKFGIVGPPGIYSVFSSTNLVNWSAMGLATNSLGSVNFPDVSANASRQKFYRVQLQPPLVNMVFIPPNTFTMGTPTNEVDRATDEGPATTVTITRGFWIGKYEVTQREYLAVIGSNPSGFPGNLDRPVETVSWLDATNYCVRLTQQDLEAGRIPPGSHYRLPTEAEWECAARAGTSTRFSHGDDLNYTEIANHAWYWFNSDIATHPVGQKQPNPWGLYDMEGNVWEWTQDWYGQYPGGSATDPQGPASSSTITKVIRGGAWDSGESNCRSGRRQKQGVHPFLTDYILGFRVVLVTEPQ